MRSKSIILTSLVAFGLASGASATTTKPAAAPAKVVKVSAKADANKAKLAAPAKARHAKAAVKSHAKPAATHG